MTGLVPVITRSTKGNQGMMRSNLNSSSSDRRIGDRDAPMQDDGTSGTACVVSTGSRANIATDHSI